MARNENARLKPSVITHDAAAFNALEKITGYVPSNPSITIEALLAGFDAVSAARTVENQIAAALATARDKTAAAEWAIHNQMLAVKAHVKAQFGKDSAEVQEIGLKKTSDYKRPVRKPRGAKPPA